jgi:hypothetical protein
MPKILPDLQRSERKQKEWLASEEAKIEKGKNGSDQK